LLYVSKQNLGENFETYPLKGERMRYLPVLAGLWLLLAIAPGAIAADDVVIPPKLSLGDAVTLALGTNAKLKQATEEKRTSLSKLKIAGHNLSFELGSDASLVRQSGTSDVGGLAFGRMSYNNLIGTNTTLNFYPLGLGNRTSSIDLSIRHPLGKGHGAFSQRGNALLSAKSDLAVQEKQFYLTQQSTALDVIQSYYQAVLAREQVKVREAAVASAETDAEGWRKREEAGMVAGIDVSRSEMQVTQTKDQLVEQQRVARNALDKLLVAIGAGVGQSPELTDGVPDTAPDVPSLGDAVQKALESRPELAISDQQIEDQKRQVAYANDQLKPTMDIVAGFNGSRTDQGLIGASILNAGLFNAGIEYTMPIDRQVSQENKDIAARQLEVLNNMRVLQMEQITEQVRSAYRSVEAAKASIDILMQNQKTAEQNLHFAKRMMEEGEGSSRDLLEAQQSLTDVQSNLLSAKTNLYLACIDLKQAMGEDITGTTGQTTAKDTNETSTSDLGK